MSQGFKLKYDQMREGNPTHQDGGHTSKGKEEFYAEESNARNICFVWINGKRIFMNYSYMVSGEYSPDDNIITLTFTTHTFILKGVHLEGLFYDILDHLQKQIICTDARYNSISEEEKSAVNEIVVIKSAS